MNLILFALQQSLGYKGIKLKFGDKIKAGHPVRYAKEKQSPLKQKTAPE